MGGQCTVVREASDSTPRGTPIFGPLRFRGEKGSQGVRVNVTQTQFPESTFSAHTIQSDTYLQYSLKMNTRNNII